jgi:hypothetical protein
MYLSRSLIITFFKTGIALPSSSIISERTSLLQNSASFSSVSSCFSKIPPKPPASNSVPGDTPSFSPSFF